MPSPYVDSITSYTEDLKIVAYQILVLDPLGMGKYLHLTFFFSLVTTCVYFLSHGLQSSNTDYTMLLSFCSPHVGPCDSTAESPQEALIEEKIGVNCAFPICVFEC